MIDATLSISIRGTHTQVFLLTEAGKTGNEYKLTVFNGSTKTQDTFESFTEAYDSFSNIVKTLMKEI